MKIIPTYWEIILVFRACSTATESINCREQCTVSWISSEIPPGISEQKQNTLKRYLCIYFYFFTELISFAHRDHVLYFLR